MSDGLMTVRRRTSSLPAPLPDDDDLLWEILLRLPPLPSSLPRASLVSKRWRRLVSDATFLRRFRAHHRNPPLLGFFSYIRGEFTPTLDPPDRIPAARFSLPPCPIDRLGAFIGCRHGFALLLYRPQQEVIVWNPVTGDHCAVPFPTSVVLNVEVMRSAGEVAQLSLHPFKLVFLCARDLHVSSFARVYDSGSSTWGDMIPTPVEKCDVSTMPSILVGNALYWLLFSGNILNFDMDAQSVTVIKKPAGITGYIVYMEQYCHILRTEGNGLGLAVVSGCSKIQLWGRNGNSNGDMRWVLQKTVPLERILLLEPLMGRKATMIVGFAEDANAIFVSMDAGVFMIHLGSMQSRKVSEITTDWRCHPYSSFFTEGRGVGGADVLEMWNNA